MVEQLVGLEDDHGFASRWTDARHLTAEEVGDDLLHFRLLELGAGFDGQLARHGAAETLGAVGEFLNHGSFIFDNDLVEKALQFAFLGVGRGGCDYEGSLSQ